MATDDSSWRQVSNSGFLLLPKLTIDSWRPRQLEAGLAAAYSMLRDLMTSIMKSAPGRSLVRTSTRAAAAVSLAGTAARTCWARPMDCDAAMAAAPVAALRTKPRRSREGLA